MTYIRKRRWGKIWNKPWKRTWTKNAGLLFAVVCMLFSLGLLYTEKIEAGTYNNAYTFYNAYENDMVFQRGNDNQGEIYYAIVGKESSASIRYKTIGWKVTITNAKGNIIDTIYYDLKGDSMVMVSESSVNGYNYQLYKVTLANLKKRMSEAARKALTTANCNILFDSCTTTIIDGVIQGGMNDSGPTWGAVYTTYDTLVKAQNWSQISKELLKSFYGKEVKGLFYNVTLHKSSGIESVSGGGKYCFGSEVTITATPQVGYTFLAWKKEKSTISFERNFTFTIYDSDVEYTAYGEKGRLKVNFFTGDEQDADPTETTYYTYGDSNQKLIDYGWSKTGFHQIGWSLTPNASQIQFFMTNDVVNDWIAWFLPEVNLYAVWEPNTYRIVYKSSGGTGSIESQQVLYTDILQLPTEGFTKEGTYSFIGWSMTKNSGESEYPLGGAVKVSTLAKRYRVQNKNNAKIPLYAVWDKGPVIYGSHIYVDLKDAQDGVITEQWFQNYIEAKDKEDGVIPYGTNANNSFLMVNFRASDYTSLKKSGRISEKFCALDSSGNMSSKTIQVHIVEPLFYDAVLIDGQVRFISKEFYKDEDGEYISEKKGGLPETSLWRTNKKYQSILDKLFL